MIELQAFIDLALVLLLVVAAMSIHAMWRRIVALELHTRQPAWLAHPAPQMPSNVEQSRERGT